MTDNKKNIAHANIETGQIKKRVKEYLRKGITPEMLRAKADVELERLLKMIEDNKTEGIENQCDREDGSQK